MDKLEQIENSEHKLHDTEFRSNEVVIYYYDKNRPEAWMWMHKDEWDLYKEFCKNLEQKLARLWFTVKDEGK